jgi:hypothetical protein
MIRQSRFGALNQKKWQLLSKDLANKLTQLHSRLTASMWFPEVDKNLKILAIVIIRYSYGE